MRYAIRLHAGGYSLVVRDTDGRISTVPYSSAPGFRDRWITFATENEATRAIPDIEKALGVHGEYSVIEPAK